MSTAREMRTGVPKVSVLSPALYNMYINDAPQPPKVYLALFADDICLHATDRKDVFVVRKLQRGLSSMETWCERWNIKINEDKTQGIYFYRTRRPPESHLTLNGRNIPFLNSVKYLDVIFDKKVNWRLHIEMIEAKAFRTFIRIYSLFKSERLSSNIKLTLHYEYHDLLLPRLGDRSRQSSTEIAAPKKQIEIFQGADLFAICTWFSNFRSCMIILQNYAGNKQNSYEIMKVRMFVRWTRRTLTQEI
jgi:hypothetical protein